MRATTTHAVEGWAIAKETTATATSISVMGSRNWLTAMTHAEGGFSLDNALGPQEASCWAAWAAVKPCSGSVPKCAATEDPDCAHHGVSVVSMVALGMVVPQVG